MLVAVSASRRVLWVCPDGNGASMDEFASAHVNGQSEVRGDDHGANIALACGWDAVVRKSAADGDSEASLPAARHVISNLEAWLSGTFHDVSVGRLQEYCDEFSWRYCYRVGDAFADLLAELVRWPHIAPSKIRSCRVAMPAHEPAAEPGHERNRKILARWRAKERKAKFPLLERMASLIVRRAGDLEPEHHEWPDEIPEDLFLILEPSFEVVSMVMHDDGLAASA